MSRRPDWRCELVRTIRDVSGPDRAGQPHRSGSDVGRAAPRGTPPRRRGQRPPALVSAESNRARPASAASGGRRWRRSRRSPSTRSKYSSPASRNRSSRALSARRRSSSLWSAPLYSPTMPGDRIEQVGNAEQAPAQVEHRDVAQRRRQARRRGPRPGACASPAASGCRSEASARAIAHLLHASPGTAAARRSESSGRPRSAAPRRPCPSPRLPPRTPPANAHLVEEGALDRGAPDAAELVRSVGAIWAWLIATRGSSVEPEASDHERHR